MTPSMSEGHAALYDAAMRCLALGLFLALVACKSDKPAETPADKSPAESQCREDVGDDVETGARTGVAGAKTGVLTAGEGLKAAGSSAAGLVEGGTEEAEKR